MDSPSSWLADYSFQALPDLGTGLRDPPKGTHYISSDIIDVIENDFPVNSFLRAAFFKVVLLYLDTRDFLFADLSSGCYTPVRAQIRDEQSLRDFVLELEEKARLGGTCDLGEIRQALGLKDGESPLPVVFVWGEDNVPGYVQSSMTLVGQGSKVHFHCDSTVMSLQTAEVFLNQVVATLGFIVSHLDDPVTSPLKIPQFLISACENEYNPASAELTPLWLMHNASSRPDAVAHEVYKTLAEPPEVVTYGALNSRSNRLARWLIGNGLQKEDKVAVCRMRDAHFYVAHAAIFKSGGCYVSIDPELPEERKRYIAQDSEARFVLTTLEQAELFGERAVVLDEVQTEIDKEDGSDICLAELDSLAYLLYTSGTTGTPKGCLLNHRGLYWAIDAMCIFPRQVTNPDTDKRLALASIAFDVHISEICQSWRLGTRLVSGPRYELLANLQENIISMGITHLGMVPSMIEATLSSPDDLPLKYLVSGGEKISDALLKKWANHPKLILANFYGPTEATVGCTSRQVKMGDRKENIGRPFSSCQAYVVDAEMNIVPRGTPGELVVEGPLVGRGYHKLPDVTKKVFLEWPRPECRCYKTGDLVRLMPDNTLEIMGRIDTQIKLRGVRIESEGVSNVLRSACSEPTDVSTLISSHPDLGGMEVLVSFVAIADSTITFLQRRSERPVIIDTMASVVQSMKDAAIRELAVYMRPSYIVPMNFLPLSINGKTDNKILAQIFKETAVQELLRLQGHDKSSVSDHPHRLPSEAEKRVIEILAQLAGTSVDSLYPSSNLFECGVDSLKFSALASALRREFSCIISAAQLMREPVVEKIALLVDQPVAPQASSKETGLASFAKRWSGVVESIFEPDQVEAILPPFPVQEGILFRSTQSPELYVQHFMYRCDASVDLNKMKACWDLVVARQQILRTAFIFDETLVQVVLKHGVNELPWHTSSCSFSEETFEEWFAREQSLSVATHINEDLTTPLFSINVYDANETGTFMVFSVNHALYDGNAMPLIINEFRQLYMGSSLREPVPLTRILEPLSHVDESTTEEFWKAKFTEVDLTARLVRHPSENRGSFMSYTLETSFSDVQAQCNASHVTLQAFFSAAFALAGRGIFRWGRDAIFGAIRSGRSLPVEDINEAICPLVSVVPTVLPIAPQTSSHELLEAAQHYINESLPHEHTPLGRIHRWLGVKDLVEVLLSCRFDNEKKVTDVVKHIASSRSQPEFIFALELVMHPTSDTVEARLSFTEADVSKEEVTAFLHQLEGCIEGLLLGQGGVSDNDTFEMTAADSSEANLGTIDLRTESILTKCIADFLHVDESTLHPTTSLTSLGLSSIKAVSLSRALLQRGIKVTPVDIIQADHIRAISKRVDVEGSSQDAEEVEAWLRRMKEQLRNDLDMDALKLSPEDELVLTSCTALQTGMLAQTINSGGRLYVHAFTFQLLPHCHIDKLKSAWFSAIQHLGILRTSFHFAPNIGQWAQIIHSVTDFKWSQVQQTLLSPSAAADLISSLSFDQQSLARPPLHFRHISSTQGDYLIVVLHHALYDGIAIPKLLQYVKDLYHGNQIQPPVPFHYIADAILAQEKEGTKYWTQALAGVTPWHFPRAPQPSDDAWRASVALDVSSGEIHRFCRRYHVHPQCTGQASWAKILCRRSKLSEVVFGQVISGRTLPDADDVIGPVFNTIPCKVSILRGQTNKQLVRSVHAWNNDGLPWQHASLRSIQRQLGVTNLLDTLFLFQPHTAQSDEDPLWTILGRGDVQETKTQHAFNIELHENGSTYGVYASCAADVMHYSGLVDLLHEFNEVFTEIVRSPNSAAVPHYDELFIQTVDMASEPQPNSTDFDESVVEAWSPKQRRMHQILVDFTGLPAQAVSPNTALTAIGIDSICAIQVAALARRDGIALVASDVARSLTVTDLLSKLDSVDQRLSPVLPTSVDLPQSVVDSARGSIPTLSQDALDRILPVSAGMEADISFWKMKPAVFAFKVERKGSVGDLSSRLRASWFQLAQKHEILRSFLLKTGEGDYRLVLGVLKSFNYRWAEEVLDPESSDDVELAAVRQQTGVFAATPIPVDQPPVRLALLHGKLSSYFVLSLHHIQYDGWSLPLLIGDLEKLFEGQPVTSESNLDGFLRLFVRTPTILEEQAAYWKGVFPSNFQPRLLPALNTQEPRSGILSYIGRFLPLASGVVSEATAKSIKPPTFVKFPSMIGSREALEKRAQSLQLSSQAILLACWGIVQAKWSSTSTATFLLSHVGRSGVSSDLDTLAAPCCNYVPTHVVMEFDPKEDLENSVMSSRILTVAYRIQVDVASRTPVVEQTRIRDISHWIGITGLPICNVSVNVLKLPGELGSGTRQTFQSLKFPYEPRHSPPFPDDPFYPEIQRDCQVEIFYRPDCDSVGISIECDNRLLSPEQAHVLALDWAKLVKMV